MPGKSRARGRARASGKSGRSYGARYTTTREKARSYGSTPHRGATRSTTTSTTVGTGGTWGAIGRGLRHASDMGLGPKRKKK